MKIDLSKCKTPEEVGKVLDEAFSTLGTILKAWQKHFGETPAPKEEKKDE